MTEAEREIWNLIRASNRAWTEGDLAAVADFFDEGAVLVKPGLGGRVEGREAIVKSYEDYVHHAQTHAFEEQEHCVDVVGDTAVATYRYAIRYTMKNEDQERDESGQEVLVLKRSGEAWKAIWRTQVPD
jgi:uncharacterized protein (TIGR02246 family)